MKSTPKTVSPKKENAKTKAASRAAGNESGIDPADQKGISGSTPYQFDNIDAINVFNGNLSIHIPIGLKFPVGGILNYQMSLSYNLKTWTIEPYTNLETLTTRKIALLSPHFNAGVGWSVSFEHLYAPNSSPFNRDPFHWLLIEKDGSQHKFNKSFQPNISSSSQSDANGEILFTQDGSFLRMKKLPGGKRLIESSDGIQRVFRSDGKIIKINDPYDNYLQFSYPSKLKTVLKDRHGRRQEVIYKEFADPHRPGQTLILATKIYVPAFGGKTATYDLIIKEKIIRKHYRHVHPEVSDTIKVPLLTQIKLPDGSFFKMNYYDKNREPLTTIGGKPKNRGFVSGLLQNISLPSGGKYEYLYGGFGFTDYRSGLPSPSSDDGVLEKRMISSKNKLVGLWSYQLPADLFSIPGIGDVLDPPDKKLITRVVTDPEGNQTVHYFYNEIFNWKHGLPFNIYKKTGGGTNTMYLSKQVFKGPTKNKKLQRSTYVRYTADQGASMSKGNARVQRQKIIFHDDGNRYIETIKSQYDGYGHFRQTETKSNFGKRKIVTQTFNQTRGNYDYDMHTEKFLTPKTFRMYPANNAWVLNTFRVIDTWQEGMTSASRKLFYFKWDTGFLRGVRIQKGLGLSKNDVLQLFESDAFGNKIKERFYGGDLQEITTIKNYKKLLPALGKPFYQTNHSYQYGALKNSQVLDTSTNKLLTFKSADFTIDKSTGLASASRDVAGLATYFEYDKSGRLVWIKPKDGKGAFTEYKYSVAPGQTYVYTRQIDNYTSGKPLQSYSYNRLDDFGRVWKENMAIELKPKEKMSSKETRYNAMGWKTMVFESRFGNPYYKTQFKSFDAFGRPREIIKPDGEQIKIEYRGIRQVKKTVRIGIGRTSKKAIQLIPVESFEIYDAQKRLVEVREASGKNGAYLSTFYEYNQDNKLTKVIQKGGTLGTQERIFEYDNRGFLLRERHPEKGNSNGNGWVKYFDFDAKGIAHRQVDGSNKVSFNFDKAERLTQIRNTGGDLLKEFKFANNNYGINKRKGKLQEAIRHNHVIVPWTGGKANIKVTEKYIYTGRNGQVSERTTSIPSSPNYNFVQKFSYTPLGNIKNLEYPVATHTNIANQFRKVEFTYNAGLLFGVKEVKANGHKVVDYAKSISYHANGLIHKVQHGNGATYTMYNDPHDMLRPLKWKVKAPVGEIVMGPYHYDGQDNITRIDVPARNGFEDFIYDKVNRLVKHTIDGEKRYQQCDFDPFGNLTRMVTKKESGIPTTRNISINTKTNRVKNSTYDTAGNQLKSIIAGSSAKYTYDAFNMMNGMQIKNFGLVHIYTIDDERIWTAKYDTRTPKNKPLVENKFSIRDLEGRLLRQFKVISKDMSKWTLVRDYFYRDKILLASKSPTEGIRHFHPDHLGTPNPITTGNGGLASFHFYHAFGEEVSNAESDTIPLKFTGHERDQDLKIDPLDYMHARYYSPLMGRFLSVDPARSGNPLEPISWNRYCYALDKPVNFTDPTGLDAMTYVQGGLDFVRGAADALTFGLTRVARESLWGADGKVINQKAYTAGEVTETAVEIALSGGTAVGKKAAREFMQEAGEKGIESARRKGVREAKKIARGQGMDTSGSIGHHIRPVKGHPGGHQARWPKPQKASDPNNIKIIKGNTAKESRSMHSQEHRNMRRLEQYDILRERTMGIRQGMNHFTHE